MGDGVKKYKENWAFREKDMGSNLPQRHLNFGLLTYVIVRQ